MIESTLLHHLLSLSAQRSPAALALVCGPSRLTYAELATAVKFCASGLVGLGLARTDRVGIWLDKRAETVIASFGAPAAGGVFVPMNPLLKPEQIGYIARDCGVRILLTSPERLALLVPVLADCPALRHVVLTDKPAQPPAAGWPSLPPGITLTWWADLLAGPDRAGHREIGRAHV